MVSMLYKQSLIAGQVEHSCSVPHGQCSNCNSLAFDVVARVCKKCAPLFNVSTFPDYTYPSELIFVSEDAKIKRSMFINDCLKEM